jgi:peptidyl-prolyl cis-trans isomerase SurA
MQLQILTPIAKILNSTMALAMTTLVVIGAGPAQAQGLFSPAILVNDDAITYFELEQRTQFLRLLRAPGNAEELARTALIQDRLKQQALDQAGIEIPPEDVEAGIEDFATRTDLTVDQFIEALAEGGVSRETLRDFVEVGILWREYIQARYLSQARPSEEDIDRALGRTGSGGVRVLLSEVIIPVTPQTLVQAEALAEQIANTPGTEAFSASATQYSASDTRTNGGRMDWIALGKLPPGLQPVILALKPGEISAPISLPNAVAIFQLRGIQETSAPAPSYASIDYATYFIAGGRTPDALALANDLRIRVDTCDDLYGIAKEQPPEILERFSKKPGEIPRDIALELAKLDVGEVSTGLTTKSGQSLIFLMLCGRTTSQAQDASREDVAQALTAQRLEFLSDSLLDQLEADALIVDK